MRKSKPRLPRWKARRPSRNGTQEQALREAHRYKALGQMIGGFVHQLRTPIHILRSNTEELLSTSRLFHNPKPQLEMMQRSADRLEASVQALLNFVKGTKITLQAKPLNPVIDQLGDFLKEECRRRSITLQKNLRCQQSVLLDAHPLQEAILNVLTNALQAMPRGGTLSIQTEDRSGQKCVLLTIRDTGTGMDAPTLARIKKPFHTTKRQGFGLGLYFTRRILLRHRAKLAITSQVGQGTTVTMSFPAVRVHS